MKDMTMESCRSFLEALGSASPTPGGGGAAALVGAIGAALGHMTGSLTVGKKRYQEVEEELRSLNARCAQLQQELLEQVQADAQGYNTVVQAYAVDRQNPDRPQIIEKAVTDACTAPLRIMVLCCDALDCIAVYAAIGSRMMASDTGSAAVCCRAALQAAALTVFTNTAHLKDRTVAEEINRRVYRMLKSYCVLADRIYDEIRESFGQ